MALITSAATGNFSAGATWTGGVVPTVGDEARASTGHTVTIDVDTACDEVSNAGTGIFTLASGVTLTANVTNKSATASRNCLQFTAASPAQGFIVGNCTSGTVSFAVAAANTSSGSLNITGNCQSSSGGNSFAAHNTSTGVINITGNCIGSSASGAEGIRNSATGTVNITGNCTGGSAGVGAQNVSGGVISIIGIATGGSAAVGVNNNSTGTTNLTRAKGNAYGPGNSGAPLAATVGASNVGLGVIQIEELEYGTFGMSPTSGTGIRLKKLSSNVAVFTYIDAGAAKTLVDATQGQMPAATDVRDGVSYASGALTGSCKVPAAASVGFGVPVDATTGTAALTPASVWDHLLTAITTSSTIGTLLKTNIDATISSRSTATTSGIADAVWDEATSDHTTSGTYGGRIVRATNANNELQINAQHHAAANVHQFQTAVITASAFDASVLTAFAVPELQEIHAIHGLKSGSALTVTPSSRSAGAISQSITGDGTTTTTVTRT